MNRKVRTHYNLYIIYNFLKRPERDVSQSCSFKEQRVLMYADANSVKPQLPWYKRAEINLGWCFEVNSLKHHSLREWALFRFSACWVIILFLLCVCNFIILERTRRVCHSISFEAFCIGIVFLTSGFYGVSGAQEDQCSTIRVVLMQCSSQTLHFDLNLLWSFQRICSTRMGKFSQFGPKFSPEKMYVLYHAGHRIYPSWNSKQCLLAFVIVRWNRWWQLS